MTKRQKKHIDASAMFVATTTLWTATARNLMTLGDPELSHWCESKSKEAMARATEEIALAMIPPTLWERFREWLFM